MSLPINNYNVLKKQNRVTCKFLHKKRQKIFTTIKYKKRTETSQIIVMFIKIITKNFFLIETKFTVPKVLYSFFIYN